MFLMFHLDRGRIFNLLGWRPANGTNADQLKAILRLQATTQLTQLANAHGTWRDVSSVVTRPQRVMRRRDGEVSLANPMTHPPELVIPNASGSGHVRPMPSWPLRRFTRGSNDMDAAYLSALSALAGSAIGATSSLITTWLTQSSTARAQRLQREQMRQETLYADFIDEASRVYGYALTHTMDDLSNMVKLYAILNRMRLFAPTEILDQAVLVVDGLVNAYFAPNPTLPELQTMLKERRVDLLEDFSVVCRKNLAPKLYRAQLQRSYS